MFLRTKTTTIASIQAFCGPFILHPEDVDAKMHTFGNLGMGYDLTQTKSHMIVIATSYGSETPPSSFTTLENLNYPRV